MWIYPLITSCYELKVLPIWIYFQGAEEADDSNADITGGADQTAGSVQEFDSKKTGDDLMQNALSVSAFSYVFHYHLINMSAS